MNITQMLVSRVCHDLAGGVGALSAGAELLTEEGERPAPGALDLIAMSARQTTHRLQFFRIAFGFGGGNDDPNTLTLPDFSHFFENYIEGSRLSVTWTGEDQIMTLSQGKLLLNLCLIASEALPRGGEIDVNVAVVDGALGFGVAATGVGASLKPDVQAALSLAVDVDTLTPRTVQGYFTAILAEKEQAQLEISTANEGIVELAALLPLGQAALYCE